MILHPNFSALVYFVYGLAFFLMGICSGLLSYVYNMPSRFIRSLKYLSAFGLLHGAVEWLLMLLYLDIFSESMISFWPIVNLLNASSFTALFIFGLFNILKDQKKAILYPLCLFTLWGLFWGIYAILNSGYAYEGIIYQSRSLRLLLGFPGSLATLIALLNYSKSNQFRTVKYKLYFLSLFFGVYAVAAGLIDFALPFFPFNILNKDVFYQFIRVPIEVVRTVLAILITLLFIQIVPHFKLEHEKHLDYLRKIKVLSSQRKALARDLHDIVLQDLFAIGMDVQQLQETQPLANDETYQKITDQLNHTMTRIRHFMKDISSSYHDASELIEKIKASCDVISNRFNVPIAFECDSDCLFFGLFKQTSLTNIYYAINEGILNAAKHSHANLISISIIPSFTSLEIQVLDNGRGFDASNQENLKFGIQTMRERIHSMNGSMTIKSSKKGTLLTFTIPWEEKNEHNDR